MERLIEESNRLQEAVRSKGIEAEQLKKEMADLKKRASKSK